MVSLHPVIILTLRLIFQPLATCYIFEFQGTEEQCWSFCHSRPSLRGVGGLCISCLKLWWAIPYCAIFASYSYWKEPWFCKVSNHSFVSCLWPDIINIDSTALGIVCSLDWTVSLLSWHWQVAKWLMYYFILKPHFSKKPISTSKNQHRCSKSRSTTNINF